MNVFHSTGYENALYAMIFVPVFVVLFICLLIAMLVVLNRKRCESVIKCTVVTNYL